MRQTEIMSFEEKLRLGAEAIEMKNQGKISREEYERIIKSIPMEPFLAKVVKKYYGASYLIESGWNLSEAEAKYGADWLNR